jgi:hypothetical protein
VLGGGGVLAALPLDDVADRLDALWRSPDAQALVHVLPTGTGGGPRWDSRAAWRYRDVAAAGDRIGAAHLASLAYLRARVSAGGQR